jgi:hypothetical protein
LSLVGNANGKLHVQRQVQDYTLRGTDFESMGFLTFTVETYERRITKEISQTKNEGIDLYEPSTIIDSSRYFANHPRFGTHIRTARLENHNSLPNIVGTWLPRRDGDEDSKAYYYASMLAFLRPWRDLRFLKDESESWEDAFNAYMKNANQRDRDVIAGCQYYYDSRSAMKTSDIDIEDETRQNDVSHLNEEDHEELGLNDENFQDMFMEFVRYMIDLLFF